MVYVREFLFGGVGFGVVLVVGCLFNFRFEYVLLGWDLGFCLGFNDVGVLKFGIGLGEEGVCWVSLVMM